MEQKITDTNFAELLASDKPVVVDFWATWCGPCKMIAPYVEQLAEEFDGQVIIGKCNIDENSDLPMQYGIRNIPTLLFFKDGKLADKQVGATTKNALKEKIEKLLG